MLLSSIYPQPGLGGLLMLLGLMVEIDPGSGRRPSAATRLEEFLLHWMSRRGLAKRNFEFPCFVVPREAAGCAVASVAEKAVKIEELAAEEPSRPSFGHSFN